MASFFGDLLTGGGESAARRASRQQQAAADENKQEARKYRKATKKAVNKFIAHQKHKAITVEMALCFYLNYF